MWIWVYTYMYMQDHTAYFISYNVMYMFIQLQHVYTGWYLRVKPSQTSVLESTNLRVRCLQYTTATLLEWSRLLCKYSLPVEKLHMFGYLIASVAMCICAIVLENIVYIYYLNYLCVLLHRWSCLLRTPSIVSSSSSPDTKSNQWEMRWTNFNVKGMNLQQCLGVKWALIDIYGQTLLAGD